MPVDVLNPGVVNLFIIKLKTLSILHMQRSVPLDSCKLVLLWQVFPYSLTPLLTGMDYHLVNMKSTNCKEIVWKYMLIPGSTLVPFSSLPHFVNHYWTLSIGKSFVEKGKSNYRNYPVNLSLMNYTPPSTQGYQTLLVNINELIH